MRDQRAYRQTQEDHLWLILLNPVVIQCFEEDPKFYALVILRSDDKSLVRLLS
jgi:hypothetical protein